MRKGALTNRPSIFPMTRQNFHPNPTRPSQLHHSQHLAPAKADRDRDRDRDRRVVFDCPARHVFAAYVVLLTALPLLFILSNSDASASAAASKFLPSYDLSNLRLSLSSSPYSSSSQLLAHAPALDIFTLAFNSSVEHRMMDHNCAILSRTRHRYHIVTDDVSQPYCAVCACTRFVPTNCPCAKPGRRNCRNCEKLEFVISRLQAPHLPHFVFLDSDLIIVRPDFADLLARRSIDFDFLAMPDDWGGPCMQKYDTHFNSGLMFMRKLPHIDYNGLRALMRRLRTNSDQGTISPFVFKYYKRWDTLSLRWHCRFIWKKEKNIPPRQCMTFHDRGVGDGEVAFNNFLTHVNRSLLVAKTSSDADVERWATIPDDED